MTRLPPNSKLTARNNFQKNYSRPLNFNDVSVGSRIRRDMRTIICYSGQISEFPKVKNEKTKKETKLIFERQERMTV
jgi:hypothetical protein